MEEKCILDPNRDCLGLMKARELEAEFNDFKKRNDSSHKEYYDRLAVLEKQWAVQSEQYRNIIEKLVSVTDSLKDLKEDSREMVDTISPVKHRIEELEKKYDNVASEVKVMKEKPGKRWEGLVEKVFGIIVAAIAGFVLAKIGLQ